jgi:hypothetical protein
MAVHYLHHPNLQGDCHYLLLLFYSYSCVYSYEEILLILFVELMLVLSN